MTPIESGNFARRKAATSSWALILGNHRRPLFLPTYYTMTTPQQSLDFAGSILSIVRLVGSLRVFLLCQRLHGLSTYTSPGDYIRRLP